MKSFKKLAGLALAMIMALALMAPAFAAEIPDGSITVDKAVDGSTYNAYRLLDLTSYAGSEATDAHAYALNDTWKGFFTTGAGKDYVEINNATNPASVTWKAATTDSAVQAFATAALKYAVDNGISADASGEAAEETVTLSSLTLGYYLVDAGVGSLLELTTTDNTVTIEEKNEDSSIDKNVTVPTGATIGDSVNYTIEVPIVKGAANYVVSDTMAEGLTFLPNSLTATLVVNGQQGGKQPVGATGTFVLTEEDKLDGKTFEITVSQDLLDAASSAVSAGAKYTIVFEYSAVINDKAVITSERTDADGNTWNEATLNYGNGKHVTTEKKNFDLYKFDLTKTDSQGNPLDGAKFKLYDENGAEVQVVKVGTGNDAYYRPIVAGETGVEIEAGSATIKGLAKGIYYLEETEAPDGYNKLTEKVPVVTTTKTDDATGETITVAAPLAADGATSVVNLTGVELPATGGIGTTIFYTLGGLLLVGSVILFVTKKRTGMAD